MQLAEKPKIFPDFFFFFFFFFVFSNFKFHLEHFQKKYDPDSRRIFELTDSKRCG